MSEATQFDISTERKADYFVSLSREVNCKDIGTESGNELYLQGNRWGFKHGRESTKASLETLTGFVEATPCECSGEFVCIRCNVIAQVKADGDWPLTEKGQG